MPGAVYKRSAPARGRSEKWTPPREDAADLPPLSLHEVPAEAEPFRPASPDGGRTEPSRSAGRRGSGLSAWEVRLTPSTLIMLAVLLLVTLVFFFVFGLIVGRGTVPPSQPAVLERLLPSEPAAEPETPETILPAEDLRFMSNLRADSRYPDDGAGQAAPSASSAPPAGSVAVPPGGSVTAPPDTARYDFVIRVAAFKAEEQADALRLRLEDAGMRTRLVREKARVGTWFFVSVLFRGTTDDMQKMRESLPAFGIRDSLVLSKAAVE
jgi:hypothetical protein